MTRIQGNIDCGSAVILNRLFCAKDLRGRFRLDTHFLGSYARNLAEEPLGCNLSRKHRGRSFGQQRASG